MYGPDIIVRSISARSERDRSGNRWQYHSRSDDHSKVACWAILFDLLISCERLRHHIARGQVVFGINHQMRDFRNDRSKNLDLVLCTPGTSAPKKRQQFTFGALVQKYGVVLESREATELARLPELPEGPVGSVRLALEAKACMTAHIKALPRLHDELNSSHMTVHGSTDTAIAGGFVMVNLADEFLSPVRNNFPLRNTEPLVTQHKQPGDTDRVLAKVRQLPRRTRPGEEGYDALGIMVVDGRNDGSPFRLIEGPPAPSIGDNFHYDQLVHRVAAIYEARFGS